MRGLAALGSIVAALAELGGGTTRLVRGSLIVAAGAAAAALHRLARDGRRPGRTLLLFTLAAGAALALHLWTYAAAPTGTLGLAADLLYWGSLALAAALGVLAATTAEA